MHGLPVDLRDDVAADAVALALDDDDVVVRP